MGNGDLNIAKGIAEFLKEYGIHAFATFLMLALIYVHRMWQKSEQEKFKLALSIAPLADAMTDLVQSAARAKARRSPPQKPEGTNHG